MVFPFLDEMVFLNLPALQEPSFLLLAPIDERREAVPPPPHQARDAVRYHHQSKQRHSLPIVFTLPSSLTLHASVTMRRLNQPG